MNLKKLCHWLVLFGRRNHCPGDRLRTRSLAAAVALLLSVHGPAVTGDAAGGRDDGRPGSPGDGKGASYAEPERRYSRTGTLDFAETLAELEFAITGHNYRITGGNTIGAAIAQRIGDDFPDSEIVHFCNLEFARMLLEASPDYLLHMPCKVVVSRQGGRILIETWLIPEDLPGARETARQVNAILRDIVDHAASP